MLVLSRITNQGEKKIRYRLVLVKENHRQLQELLACGSGMVSEHLP